jgi:hypothetical protein
MTDEEEHLLAERLTSLAWEKTVIYQEGSHGSCEGSSLKGKDQKASRHACEGQARYKLTGS